MRKLWLLLSGTILLLVTIQSSAVPVQNGFFGQDRFDRPDRDRRYRARLSGFQENPTLSSPAGGEFVAKVSNGEIQYRLVYWDLPTNVLFAHIHFGAQGINGGIAAFLCSDPNGVKPACPNGSGVVSGTIRAEDIIGPTAQGIAAGEYQEVVRALRNGAVYANVHTQQFGAGEIRGQVLNDDDN